MASGMPAWLFSFGNGIKRSICTKNKISIGEISGWRETKKA